MAAEASRFTSEAGSFRPLAAMRIILGIVLLAQAYVLWRFRDLLLDPMGPIPWALSDLWLDPWLPKLSDLAGPFAAVGLGVEAVVATVLGLHAIAAAFLMLGYRTRLSALVAWATFVLLKNSSPAFLYGVGSVLLIALFYCLFMPVAREWSLDRTLKVGGVRTRPADASFSIMVLRIHVCIVYAEAGLSKAVGEQWWSGEALWRALSQPQFSQYDLSWLSSFPVVLQLLAIATILLQLSYPLLVWTRARVAIVVLNELLHVGIAVFLGLWLFSLMMVALNTAAFGESVWKAFARRIAVGPGGSHRGDAP